MGLHRDSDEKVGEPIVSLSLGAACVFRLGNTDNRSRPWTDVGLHSGDLLVLGDQSRLAYHGVPKLLPEVEVPDIGLSHGRLNLTLRVSGLAPASGG
jgi:alkylated DNA repair protein (DNA oxidative demethylase)